jgi:hypothetical protein
MTARNCSCRTTDGGEAGVPGDGPTSLNTRARTFGVEDVCEEDDDQQPHTGRTTANSNEDWQRNGEHT